MARKAMLGNKLRRLRRDRNIAQVELARRLGISASYLNLIEHNNRNVTVGLLLKLAEEFELNITDLAEDDESQLVANLMEAFDDALFEESDLTNVEIRELVGPAPVASSTALACTKR